MIGGITDGFGTSLAALRQADARFTGAIKLVAEGGTDADALAAAAQLLAQAQQQQAAAGITLRTELDQQRMAVNILA
ncbi:hypothetical protein [Ferrovibrio sp.]|uniref:hypothetical protein n=1 Tax=Ferrovibrio sp. TaxID=1917215 RepID=UPI0025C3FF6A|nr:hypothetical protein [Ferrovibrio sp.]MBX3455011.1 hypothetical protein [Ferrovibrio sp.]